MRQIRRVCVFCGSSPGRGDRYRQAAEQLATQLVREKIAIVYGGARVGLMGVVADTALELGGEVIGVMTEQLMDIEIGHRGLTELHVVDTMAERKRLLAELSDGFISLPGGLGTLEELFEMVVLSQLALHDKPSGILNVDGYYDHLEAFLRHAVDEELIKPRNLDLVLVADDAAELISSLRTYEVGHTPKWIEG